MTTRRLKRKLNQIPGVHRVGRKIKQMFGLGVALGPQGIEKVGHREYVGGMWEEIGQLQFDFLCSRGLTPNHYLLDIACGSLRAGVHFIRHLEPGHYLGVEKEQLLLDAAIEKELDPELYEAKQPQLLCSDCFAFDKFGVGPNFALAQSLFTHLPDRMMHLCFANLRKVIAPDGMFFATFHEADRAVDSIDENQDYGYFLYTREQMAEYGKRHGFTSQYIGEWGHPREQKMMQYQPI